MKKEYFNHLVAYGDFNERVLSLAVYVIEKNATVRETAKEFGISKSTVHKDCLLYTSSANKDKYFSSLYLCKNKLISLNLYNIKSRLLITQS